MATWEEARKCPKCSNAGKESGTMPTQRRGTKVVKLVCENPLCRWFETGWVVQINPDGSIPDPESALNSPKQFVVPTTSAEANALIRAANEQGEAAYRITQGELGGGRG
jgi:hypothetical protein